jgi:hypothetical protein
VAAESIARFVAVSWQGLDFDFTGVDFNDAGFSGGAILFTNARFSSGVIGFYDGEFYGAGVDFTGAMVAASVASGVTSCRWALSGQLPAGMAV